MTGDTKNTLNWDRQSFLRLGTQLRQLAAVWQELLEMFFMNVQRIREEDPLASADDRDTYPNLTFQGEPPLVL